VWAEPELQPDRTFSEKGLHVDPQNRVFCSSELPPASLYPRVALRWISGMLAGGSELAGAPAVTTFRCAADIWCSLPIIRCGGRKRREVSCSGSIPRSISTIWMQGANISGGKC